MPRGCFERTHGIRGKCYDDPTPEEVQTAKAKLDAEILADMRRPGKPDMRPNICRARHERAIQAWLNSDDLTPLKTAVVESTLHLSQIDDTEPLEMEP